MPHHCCVPQCTSDTRHTACKDLSFHSFPSNSELAKKWIVAIKRDIGPNFKVTKSTKVCSKHFTEECYRIGADLGMRSRLKKGAIPSMFNWTLEPKSVRRKLIRASVIEMPKKVKVTAHNIVTDVERPSTKIDENVDASEVAHNTSSDDSLAEIDCDPSPDKHHLKRANLQLLALRNEEIFSIIRFSQKDGDIKYYTGFPSYHALNCFYNFLLPEANFLYYVGTENTSEGTPYALLSKRGPSRSLSPLEELFITLVRLRKGFHEKHLADLYKLSEGHISKIINTWIAFLANRLSALPIWPQKEQVQETMPLIFKKLYPSTRVIIDCTELFIEQPSAADCQRETFSTYKHHNTAKGLIGISPTGQITFVSPLYAGRCSDKKIIRHCGLLDLMEEGDGLMADRGFDIQDDLVKRGATLIMPSFLQGQDQFDNDQLTKSRTIASVRVHVERAVRKVKEFEILRNTIPVTLCPMLEKIWCVCCHLSNFTGTLFKNS